MLQLATIPLCREPALCCAACNVWGRTAAVRRSIWRPSCLCTLFCLWSAAKQWLCSHLWSACTSACLWASSCWHGSSIQWCIWGCSGCWHICSRLFGQCTSQKEGECEAKKMKRCLLNTLCFCLMLSVGSELSIGRRPACGLFLWSCRPILPATQVEASNECECQQGLQSVQEEASARFAQVAFVSKAVWAKPCSHRAFNPDHDWWWL